MAISRTFTCRICLQSVASWALATSSTKPRPPGRCPGEAASGAAAAEDAATGNADLDERGRREGHAAHADTLLLTSHNRLCTNLLWYSPQSSGPSAIAAGAALAAAEASLSSSAVLHSSESTAFLYVIDVLLRLPQLLAYLAFYR